MRTKEELKKRLRRYSGAKFIYKDFGYIAWQTSTGENTHLIFIEAKEKRKGYGTLLMKEFVKNIKPYNSVFLFRLAKNEYAGAFYRSLGFQETLVKGLYTEDGYIGVVSFNELCKNLSTK